MTQPDSLKFNILQILRPVLRRLPRGLSIRLLNFIYSPNRRQNDYFDIVDEYGSMYISVNTRSYIEHQIFCLGSYEPNTTKLLKRFLKPGMWAIDVGANIGAFTLIMARQVGETGRVLAIEPYPFVAERLVENLSLNRMLNVQVVMCALADRSKTATLYVPDPKWPNQGVASLSLVRGSQLVSQIEVQCFTLDDLLVPR